MATGLILLITLPPAIVPRQYGPEYLVFGILATFPPLLFMLHGRPRGRRHWVYLGLCLPAMYAASLTAPFAIFYIGTTLFSSEPGAVSIFALVAFVYAALNAPFAALLVKSGACALKPRDGETLLS